MRRHRQSSEPLCSINLTSLLDITFVLLISFMIVAPALKHGIEMELPEVREAQPLETPKTLSIAIKATQPGETMERIYVDDQRVTLNELEDRVGAFHRARPDLDVVIEADKRVPYGRFMEVLATVKSAGVDNIGLAALPLPKEKER